MIVSCPPSYQAEIRHVVALNNIAVTLLELKCYGQALDTFQDAILLIYQIVHAVDATTQCETIFLLFRSA
jgi:hypothetical protein